MSMFNTTKSPPKTPVKAKDASPTTTVRKTVEKAGQVVSDNQTDSFEFAELSKGDGNATISCSLTKGVDFNSEKVTFFVSVKCDQTTEMMDLAAEKAFMKAMSYVNDAADLLGWERPK